MEGKERAHDQDGGLRWMGLRLGGSSLEACMHVRYARLRNGQLGG